MTLVLMLKLAKAILTYVKKSGNKSHDYEMSAYCRRAESETVSALSYLRNREYRKNLQVISVKEER